MGLDLTLCPDQYFRSSDDNFNKWFLAYTRINLTRNYYIFSQIADVGRAAPGYPPICCSPRPLPPEVEFQWYDDEGLRTTVKDPYGDPLTYLLAEEVGRIVPGEAGPWNLAVLAMMRALPPKTPVVLWWH